MFRQFTLITLLVVAVVSAGRGQETWSLEKCVNFAQQNSLRVKQARYNVQLSELSLRGTQLSRLPSVNANLSGGYNFGKSINPTTNQFESNRNFSGQGSISAGIILFDGLRINNTARQNRLDIQASELDAQTEINTISLQVAQAYLNILLAEEQLVNARNQLQLSQAQLEQANRQIAAGTLPENNRLDFQAQIARNEQTIIEAENLLDINYLNLKQLMEIDPNTDLQIERPARVEIPSDANPDLFQTNQVFASALNTQPQIRAGEMRLESANVQEKIARSGAMPRLTLFGNLNTRFFNLTKDLTRGEQIIQSFESPVLINGEPATVTFYQSSIINAPNMSFFDQLNNFFGQGVGFQLSVPIYNNHQNLIAVERARVNALNQAVINRQTQQQLKTDVQRAVANAKASRRSMEAAERTRVAASAAFENAQRRFELGAINSLEFTTARNNLDQAEVEITRAKFQYLFDLKVVDFYLGKELRID